MKNPISAQQDSDQDEIDLGALAIILWSGKWWIALTCTAAIIVGAAWLLNTPPTYQANALIQIEEKAASLALPDGLADVIGKTPVGRLTPPQRTGDGYEMIAVCSAGGAGTDSSAAQEVRQELLAKKLEGVAEKLYAPLRKRAIIVKR